MKHVSWLLVAATLVSSGSASAISRDEAIARAKAFAFHPWHMTSANKTGGCGGGYTSTHKNGDYLGLPYDWGGYMTLFEFDQQIAAGYGAGSYPEDGVLECTSGLDCSGFVSQCWGASHHTTSNLADISSTIGEADLIAGDIFNQAGFHTAMFSHMLASGDPALYEAVGYNVHVNTYGGWAYLEGYVPLRYKNITGTSASAVAGSLADPIVVSSFPYEDSRSTVGSKNDMIDGCAAKASADESGPEYVYQLKFDTPGTLTVSVADDAGVDIDVELMASASTNDCVSRDDSTLSYAVDCGTYYVVADTFGASAGNYTISMSFDASAASCGSGEGEYSFEGKPGTTCSYEGHPNLGWCNPNLGGDTCIYSEDGSFDSFCSMPCTKDSDCADMAGGAGCCGELSDGATYCLSADFCEGSSSTSSSSSGTTSTSSSSSSSSSSTTSSGNDGGSDSSEGGSNVPGAGGGSSSGSSGGGAPSGEGPNGDSDKSDADTSSDGGCAVSQPATDPNRGAMWVGVSLLLAAVGRVRSRRQRKLMSSETTK